ncbi:MULTISPECIES: sulfite exporter TauE/SafE family protein [Haloferax]|nr:MULTISPECIES: sulfite exporter TauE/SafE family protein [Haloferax]RDZ32510.1 sulfite exporter TauE/SafE family protein [Haloferax sp. Atlit-48N]RDZ37799.1 sulfite exporter TauE/SafE family protein [Haloferax sp. Atlit-24N]RDZ40697.1 sulfite exporter TauE/SafE family protein [Haloferax sp. Atlit-47N]RLM38594.1 sulfite exporter TauE/SafE family protein [Haloferax sp. Atlit-109R]RLM46540.1 sulfite exporter TauE/SafE family protein [Haloferax sp. Atlit-105R]TVT95961.1 sulfite exporter TauE/Sa
MSAGLLALFVAFGVLIGVLFGFFGMGGSFLVTPALLVMGYPSRVAVGSGLAFVFGTSVIATLKHRDLGQVDYKLGISMIIGTTVGLEVGKEIVLYLEELGLAGNIISVTYVLLLGGIGLFVTYEALKGGDGGGVSHDVDGDADVDADDIPELAKKIQSYSLPPMITLRGGVQVSLWMILLVAFATGLLSGFLGVGGGFIRMPALFYLIGVPVPIAVGTDLFEIMFSGGIGSFLYAQSGGVDLSIVAPLLAGSALGARVGSAATSIVDEDEIKIYFGLMLLLGALAVAVRQAGNYLGVGVLDYVSLALILGSALMVSGAVLYSAVKSMRAPSTAGSSTAD